MEYPEPIPVEPLEPLPDALPETVDAAAENVVADEQHVSRWRRFGAALGVAASLLISGCTAGHEAKPAPVPSVTLPGFDTNRSQDLLAGGTWQYMPGVAVRGSTLEVQHTGEAILELQTPGRPPRNPQYEANPPVNLFGTHVESDQSGNVGFSAQLSDLHGSATVSFLSAPNRVFDESLERQAGVDVVVDGSTATIDVWNGSSDQPSVIRQLKLGHAAASANIVVAQTPNELKVDVDGQQTTVATQVLDRQTWFSFNAANSWTMQGLYAYPLNGNTIHQVDMSKAYQNIQASPDGLSTLAATHGHADKLIGTAVSLPELMSDPNYASFVIQNFNELETENLAKFQNIQPEQGQFQFNELDALVKFAQDHNMQVHGHALAFTEAYPQWLSDVLNDPATTRDQAIAILRDHIQTVVSRYDGHHGHGLINYWDVVNEPFDTENWGQLNQQSIWYKKIGPDYIPLALQFAHQANPRAELGINDWAIETDSDRRAAMLNLVTQMRKQLPDVPLFVGFQAHFDEDTLNDSQVMDQLYSGQLSNYFKQFAAQGVKVRISEASVAQNNDPQTQADVYGMLMQACMQAGNCIGFNMWGATSNEFYFTSSRADGIGDDAPMTQSNNGSIAERPAMQALRDAVTNNG